MLVAERGAASNTRQAYERDLIDVAAWLTGREQITTIVLLGAMAGLLVWLR